MEEGNNAYINNVVVYQKPIKHKTL
jgi:hypothetical protein